MSVSDGVDWLQAANRNSAICEETSALMKSLFEKSSL